MSNGRSGAFWIAKAQFEMLLGALPRVREVGVLGMMNASVAEVKRVLAQQNSQIAKLFVEERDFTDYIVHLSAVHPSHEIDHAWTWLSVREHSPIYRDLRLHYLLQTKKPTTGAKTSANRQSGQEPLSGEPQQ